MTGMEWVVLALGVTAVALVNWWFFWAERSTATAVGTGVQEVNIVVSGGYSPATIKAQAGRPLRLVFDRQETNSCSEEIVIPEFGVRRYLPAHEKTAIEVQPNAAGTYDFTCGMSMLRGRIIVE